MKYRIKIVTFQSGRKVYAPQVKRTLGWSHINYDGALCGYESEMRERNSAIEAIDKRFAGNTKRQTIEFEYINKYDERGSTEQC